ALAKVTPTHPQADVQIPEALAGDQILAGKQPRTRQVSKAQGNLRYPIRLPPQPEAGIHGLVLVALVAAEVTVFTAVGTVGHRGITQRAFQPRQRRDGNAVTAVGRSEEHTSELQSRENLVCRLLLEKKKTQQ